MRTRGPNELQPRQLRVLVLLLVVLPVVPMTFVVWFVAEGITDQRLEARERARPVYQKFLDATTETLIVNATRQVPSAAELDPARPWRVLHQTPSLADTVFIVSPEGALTVPAAPAGDSHLASAAGLAEAVLQGGVRYAPHPLQGPVRWRFFCELPEPLFVLRPPPAAPGGPTLVLLKSRPHLLEMVGTFFQRELDPQTVLRLIDENGDIIPLVGPAESVSATGGDPLAESTLQPPLPAWRVQLFSVDAALVDGVARGQIALYWWSVLGMFAVTASIAGTAGWAVSRRLALHELGNDALAVVSHEMKTPLTSMRMFIETLREKRYHGGPEQADEYLDLIADENARLVRLVEGFQTVSRLDNLRARGRGLRREPVRAEEVIDAARQRMGPRLEGMNGRFRVEAADPPSGPFPADREALAAVLANLIDNAIKYSAEDQPVTLRTFAREGEVVFEVADRGIGIDPSEQRRIFERFYQSDQRLSRSHEGCGLGLSIVRSVVRAHGGSVSVQSSPGVGSTFTIRLPAQRTAN